MQTKGKNFIAAGQICSEAGQWIVGQILKIAFCNFPNFRSRFIFAMVLSPGL